MTQAPARPLLRSSAAELTLDRLGPSFGAEVIGLDLSDADQVAFGRRLGEVTVGHPVVSSAGVELPEIFNIDSADPEFSFSDVWHTDVTFMERPPLGSILRAVQLPSYGGDTSWVDTVGPFESLL